MLPETERPRVREAQRFGVEGPRGRVVAACAHDRRVVDAKRHVGPTDVRDLCSTMTTRLRRPRHWRHHVHRPTIHEERVLIVAEGRVDADVDAAGRDADERGARDLGAGSLRPRSRVR